MLNYRKEVIMKIIKRATAFLLLVLLCLPMTVFAAGQEAAETESQESASETKSSVSKNANGMISTDDFEIRVVCGLDNNYRSGAAIPVTIYIESLNEDFEGIVRMIVPGSTDYGTEATAYEKDVMLSAGTQKIVTMSVYSSSGLTSLKFQLEDVKRNIVIDKTVTMKSQADDSALTGVLSDDYSALNYFDGQGIYLDSYVSTIRLVELSEDIFPEQASGLEALSYLIINSYDTSKLSDAQYLAIKNWVDQGGVLIIGTGSDYRQTLSAFQDDLVRGTIGTPVSGVLQLANDTEVRNSVGFQENSGIISLSLEDGASVDGVLTDSSLIWNRDYGQGHVIVTAFNLGMEPINSWSQKSAMVTLLLEKSTTGYSSIRLQDLNYGGYTISNWMLSSALDRLHTINYPDMQLIIIIFVIFVILVGPGLYLLLKLVDKREWMWFLVPVLAVGFAAGVFGISQDMRITNPREASVTALYYNLDSGNRAEQVYMGIQVPDADEQTVFLDSSLSNLKLAADDYGGYYSVMSDGQKYDYKTAVRETAEGYQLNIRNKSTFGSTYMALNHVPGSEMGEQPGLELDLERRTTGISGTVTNNTGRDLHWVSIYTQSRVIMIGDLKAGESAEVKESDTQYFDYDMYSINIPGYVNDSKEFRRQSDIWCLFANQYVYSMGQSDVYVYASIDSWEADYVSDAKIEEHNMAVLVLHKTMGYSDYDGAQILNLYDYAKTYGDDWNPDGMMAAQTAEVAFDIGRNMSEVYALIRAKDTEAPYFMNTSNVNVYGFNVETGQFDELFTDGENMEFKEGCPYMSKDGIIRLRFDCKNVYEDYSPQITVVGGDKDAGN